MNATEKRVNPGNTMFPWYKTGIKVCVLSSECMFTVYGKLVVVKV